MDRMKERFGLFVTLAVVFGMWLARVHANAATLSGPLRDSTGWAVGAWYIPFAGGFLAAGPLGRLWERGPGGSKARPYAWATLFSSYQLLALVGYIFVFVSTFSTVFAAMGRHQSAQQAMQPFQLQSLVLQTALAVLYIVTGVLMMLTIRDIQSWQTQAFLGGTGPGRPTMASTAAGAWR